MLYIFRTGSYVSKEILMQNKSSKKLQYKIMFNAPGGIDGNLFHT